MRRTLLVLILAFTTGDVAAQQTARASWFPDDALFRPLLADPHQPRYTAALIGTNLFERSAESTIRPGFEPRGVSENTDFDVQGAVGLGIEIPVYRIDAWPGGGVDIGATAVVFARFRMEEPSRDEVGSDWWVGVPIFFRDGPWDSRFRIVHRSSHLGDEVQEYGARRIEYSYEGVDAVIGYRLGEESGLGGRVYGGGTFILHNASYIYDGDPFADGRRVAFDDRGGVQAGAELIWLPWKGGAVGVEAGLDWQRFERSEWRDALALTAGLYGRLRGREARLRALCFDGPSPMGEFFRTDERYCGLEATVLF